MSAAATPLRAIPKQAENQGYGYTFTDDGNSLRLIDRYGHRIRYVPERGQWLTWAGHRWEWDTAGRVTECAKAAIRGIDPGDDEKLAAHRSKSLSRRAIEATVALAKTDPRMVVPAATLDADGYVLCTPAGVVDLRTGKSRPSSPDELHTRSTPVAPDFTMPTPSWDQFLADTFAGHDELVPYIQRLAGISAVGTTLEHVLPFLFGEGRNGKGVLTEVMLSVLGDYASTAPLAFLLAGQHNHETEIARLHGLRLVVCGEVDEGAAFAEAKVKLLTGGDTLTGRFMHKDHVTFSPTHTLWQPGNHKPEVRAGGSAFWERCRLIGFPNVVPREKRIKGFAGILADEEGPGILAWIIRGAVEALKDGLRDPDSVLAETDAYAASEDQLARFTDECCRIGGGDGARVNAGTLRRTYVTWCSKEGEKQKSPQAFAEEMRRRGCEPAKSGGKRYYRNVMLLNPDDDDAGSWQ